MTTVLREYIAKTRMMLRDTLLELLPNEGSYPTSIPGLSLHRFDHAGPPEPMTCIPMLVVVVQGKKWVKIGMEEFVYGEHTCFVTGVNTAVFCCVKEASPEKPCLALTIDLDRILLFRLMMMDFSSPEFSRVLLSNSQIRVINDKLLDACLRLLRLQDKPAQIPFLAPLFRQEIHYRLLTGYDQSNPVHIS